MPEQWTAQLVGELHLRRLTARQLAAQVGWNEKYLSAVLNGHRAPKGARAVLEEALAGLIQAQEKDSTTDVP